MDHHCMWMGTCIGFLNQKFYWQFLLYSDLSVFVIFLTVLFVDGLALLADVRATALFVSTVPSFCNLTFLLVYQTLRIAENYTIEEQHAK